MNNNSYKSKLTPAAKEVLNEVVEDYRLQILKEANLYASDVTGEIREVAVKDLLHALQKLDSTKDNTKTAKIKFILIVYVFFGVLTSFLAAVYTQFSESHLLDLFGLVGSLLALISFVLYINYTKPNLTIGSLSISTKANRLNKEQYSRLLIMQWRKIEILSKDVLSNIIGESEVDNLSLRVLMTYLEKFKIFNPDELNIYLELFRKRNKVTHSNKTDISTEEFNKFMNSSDILIKKLLFTKKKAEIQSDLESRINK
jgi:hypothetical protein